MKKVFIIFIPALLLVATLTALAGAFKFASTGDDNIKLRSQIELGEKIFLGQVPLNGKLAGHQDNLPGQVAKCVNCHAPTQNRRPGQYEYAPLLTPSWLLQPHVRRGGPAFAYDQRSFCQTIRTGMDPEYVILNRAMPRFELSAQQCQALWAFLTENRNNEKK